MKKPDWSIVTVVGVLVLVTVIGLIVRFGNFSGGNATAKNTGSGSTYNGFVYATGADGVTINGYVGYSTAPVLPEIIAGQPVTTIAKIANSALTAITLPETVKTIGAGAFSGCNLLTQIDLPTGLTTIGERAFYQCRALTQIYLPATVRTIGAYAFYNCGQLTTVNIDDLAAWCRLQFTAHNNPLAAATAGCRLVVSGVPLTTFTLPAGLTAVGAYQFTNCAGLTRVDLTGATQVGVAAFSGAEALTTVTVPATVTQIGMNAFFGCRALTAVQFAVPTGWEVSKDQTTWAELPTDLTNVAAAANALSVTFGGYPGYYWRRA